MSDNDLIRRGDAWKALDWGDIYGRNAQDAINAIPAAQPTVKPLVWKGDSIRVTAKGMSKYYACMRMFHGQKGAGWEDDEGDWHPTLEAAKAAAQADYEARILSVLDVQPTVSPDVAALVDALDRTTSHGQRSEYSRVGHHLNEASWHVHLAGFKSRDDAEAFLAAALARVKGVM